MQTNILALLAHGLRTVGAQHTKQSLGNRSHYVGLSDIGKGINCLRAAVAGKTRVVDPLEAQRPMLREQLPALVSKELRLQRGHWFEQGAGKALKASGVVLLSQLGISLKHKGVPIQGHLDFVLVFPGKNPRVVVVECKSCEHIPEFVYAAHEIQMYGQIGLLKQCWNSKSFRLENTAGNDTFPGLVRRELGINLPDSVESVRIEGAVLTLSMNKAQVSGPYLPNSSMLHACLTVAENIWQAAQAIRKQQISLDDVPVCTGFNPLCDYCEYNALCPRFVGISAPELERELLYLQSLKEHKEALAHNVQTAEAHIKQIYQALEAQGNWVNATSQRFRLARCEGRKSLNRLLLQNALAELLPADVVEQVLEKASTTGAAYERLCVGTINR